MKSRNELKVKVLDTTQSTTEEPYTQRTQPGGRKSKMNGNDKLKAEPSDEAQAEGGTKTQLSAEELRNLEHQEMLQKLAPAQREIYERVQNRNQQLAETI